MTSDRTTCNYSIFLSSAEKKKEGELADFELFAGQSAFLGPQLWDNDPDFKLEYMDLDEFLNENGIDTQLSPENSQSAPSSGAIVQSDLQSFSPVGIGSPPQSPHATSKYKDRNNAELNSCQIINRHITLKQISCYLVEWVS